MANFLGAEVDLAAHVRHVIDMLTSGTLTTKFREDPLGTAGCILMAVAFLVDQLAKHDGVPDVVAADPLAMELAEAIGAPATGPLSSALLTFIISQLMKKLQEMLDDWLDGQQQ